ncbi:MAG: hypothetical protein WDN24_03875 [Sphingomonas sp.]
MSPRSPIRRSVASRSRREPPSPRVDLLGQPHPLELAETSGGEALLEGIAPIGHDAALGVHRRDQPAVESGQPLLLDFRTQPRFDLGIGAWPKSSWTSSAARSRMPWSDNRGR